MKSNSKQSLLSTNIMSCIASSSLLVLSTTTNVFASSPIIQNFAIPFTFAFTGTSLFYYFTNSKWTKRFKSIGLETKDELTPILYKTEKDEFNKKYYFTLPDGISHKDFITVKDKIESSLRHPVTLSYTNDYKTIIQLNNKELKYQKEYKPDILYNTNNTIKSINALNIPIGITLSKTTFKEETVYMNLTNEPNILVAGINGSGKTTCILSILTHLCISNAELKIINLKGNGDYHPFKNYINTSTYISGMTSIKTILDEISDVFNIMKARNNLLEKSDCRDFLEYNKKYRHKQAKQMHPIIVIIEEFVMLSDIKKNYITILNQLLSLSRAVNIKFIITVQRPCSDNIKSTLKANLNHTLAFKAKTSANSEVILDKGDYRCVNDLHDVGEGILVNINKDILFKSYYLAKEEIENILKSHNKYKVALSNNNNTINSIKPTAIPHNKNNDKNNKNNINNNINKNTINKGVGLLD